MEEKLALRYNQREIITEENKNLTGGSGVKEVEEEEEEKEVEHGVSASIWLAL